MEKGGVSPNPLTHPLPPLPCLVGFRVFFYPFLQKKVCIMKIYISDCKASVAYMQPWRWLGSSWSPQPSMVSTIYPLQR